ncbi:MAG: GNAT family N-acetyltransferase [Rudaea sp.]|nr:GNAT family N-acetyltransferase [Rudaea sp.]
MQVLIANSIEAIGRDEWNRLFPAELEDWHYYQAVERAGLPGFDWLYFGVREDGVLRAVVPAFVTDYRLDTTLTGRLRNVTNAIARIFPGLLRQRMLSLGSPVGEVCHLGFAPGTDAAMQCRLLGAIMEKVEEYTMQHRIGMIAVKDASAAQDDVWTLVAQAHRLRRQPGLPTALLDVHFASLDDYLRALSPGTRKDMRRKLRPGARLRVEWRNNVDDIIDDVVRLYRSTFANAELNFEELTPGYFSGVLRELGDRASCVTYWLDERIVAFNLVLHDGRRLLDKFLGMDYTVAREYNMYFFTWMENVRYCIERGLPLYQSGQGLHREKLRLGSRLSANWLWYRHRNRLLDFIFASAERLFRLDRHDAELAALNPDTRR